MATIKRNSGSQSYTNNADGFTLKGGTTERAITVSVGDINAIGGGAGANITFPSSTTSLVGTDIQKTLSKKTIQTLIFGTQVITTSGITTTLLVTSVCQTIFNGSQSQTLVLPNATTLTVGQQYFIHNATTGLITVQTNGGAELLVLNPNTDASFICQDISTAAGTWEIQYVNPVTIGLISALSAGIVFV